MSDHYATTKDEAPPTPSRFKLAGEREAERWSALVDQGLDRAAIMERMGITSERARKLARRTGKVAPVDRGAGECREAMGVRGYDHGARGGRRA